MTLGLGDGGGRGKEKFKDTTGKGIGRIFFVNNEITQDEDMKNGREKGIVR